MIRGCIVCAAHINNILLLNEKSTQNITLSMVNNIHSCKNGNNQIMSDARKKATEIILAFVFLFMGKQQ